MSWAVLPETTKRDVVQYLDRDELKSLRLVSRVDLHSATSELFKKIHPSPSTRSFDRARAVARSRSLSSFVQNIVFHVELLPIDYQDLDSFGDGNMSLKCYPNVTEWDDESIIQGHREYRDEIRAQIDFQTQDQAGELKELCQHFVALRSISTVMDHDTSVGRLTDLNGQRVALPTEPFSWNGSLYLADLFGAVATAPLTMICALSATWNDISSISERHLITANLRNLKRLNVKLSNEEFLDQRYRSLDLNRPDTLLRASITSNDYTLELDFETLPYAFAREDL